MRDLAKLEEVESTVGIDATLKRFDTNKPLNKKRLTVQGRKSLSKVDLKRMFIKQGLNNKPDSLGEAQALARKLNNADLEAELKSLRPE